MKEGKLMNYKLHPGTIIKYILISMGKKQKWLATEMNMSKVVINELIHGKRNVTPQIAIAFEKATEYSADKLLKAQAEYDLYVERKKCGIIANDDEAINEMENNMIINAYLSESNVIFEESYKEVEKKEICGTIIDSKIKLKKNKSTGYTDDLVAA